MNDQGNSVCWFTSFFGLVICNCTCKLAFRILDTYVAHVDLHVLLHRLVACIHSFVLISIRK